MADKELISDLSWMQRSKRAEPCRVYSVAEPVGVGCTIHGPNSFFESLGLTRIRYGIPSLNCQSYLKRMGFSVSNISLDVFQDIKIELTKRKVYG